MENKDGFLNSVKRQLRSVVQWENPDPALLFERWTENGDEIKNLSKLIVGPGQGCLFVYQGKVEGVFTKEGMVDLATDNIPFWTTVVKVMQSFESEHKVGIFFFRQSEVLNNKWGTTSVIKYNDPVYKFPVGLRAHGNYSYKIVDPQLFFTNVVGGHERYVADNIREVITARLSQPLTDFLAESKHSYVDIDAMREEIAEGLIVKISGVFEDLGFAMTDFRIEGTSFDADTIRRINQIADKQAEMQAAEAVGLSFSQMEQLAALREAARNEGGVAGMGVGMGAGLGLGNIMGGVMGANMTGQPGASESGKADGANDPKAKLSILKQMHDEKLISTEEYENKKKEILDNL